MANGKSDSDALITPPDGFTSHAIVVTLIGTNNEPLANDDSGPVFQLDFSKNQLLGLSWEFGVIGSGPCETRFIWPCP